MQEFDVGDIVAGKYEIKKVLGTGGMGKVFRARQVDLGRDVALKVPSQAVLNSPEIMARFSREARTVAKLTHDNIVQVYEYFHEGDMAFIAMEFVEGQDLKEFISTPQPNLTVGDMAQILEAACEGMAHAHEAGIIHRDIKPHNIMVARLPRGKWRVKVMDFGIAHIDPTGQFTEVNDGQLTQTGQALGTPSYMSPEQIRGTGVSHLSDIYSFGCVVYYVFTKNTVFQGSGLTVAVSHLNELPPSVRNANPNLPEELDAVIQRCLEKDATKRPQHGSELGAIIAAALSPIGDKPMSDIWAFVGLPGDATIPIIGAKTHTPSSSGTGKRIVEVQTHGTLPQTAIGQRATASPAGGMTAAMPALHETPSSARTTKPPGDGTPTSTMPTEQPVTRSLLSLPVLLGGAAVLALLVGVLAVMVLMSGEDASSGTGEDPNQHAAVDPSPVATPATDPTGTPTATPTVVATATPSPAPTPVPTATPDPVAERLGRFRSQLAETTEPEILAGIWSAAMKMMAEAPANRKEEIKTLADGVATKLTRNPRMIPVEEGRFTMGRDGEGSSQDERPVHLVMLSPFLIGQYEVTALEFATFLNDNKDRAALLFRPTDKTTVQFIEAEDRYAPLPDKEFHAANGISWTAANAYAEWLARVTGRDFRLPTEAEWERAARGTERSIYPWGSSDPDVSKATYGNGSGPVRVDSHPAYRSTTGAFNTAGNVAEWVADWYVDTAYETGALRTNPRGPGEPPAGIIPRRVIRGGGFLSLPDELASTRRQRDQPDRADALYGFRLALTP